MTLQDDFVTELRHAADRVEPVAALDGAAMGRRAVRRVRARRAALTGVGALAAAGAVAGVWQGTSPDDVVSPASQDVPAGWTPVAVGGVRLAVPPGLEPSVDGVWEQGPADEGGDFVQVEQSAGMPLVPPGSGLTPTDVRVPGAESARYVTEDHGDDPSSDQDFVGRLQVTLESGDVVQVSLVWVDGAEADEVFADLVGSVSVDEDPGSLPAPEGAAAALQPLEGYAAGVPEGWESAEFVGLGYAVPPGWAADREVADAYPAGATVRSASADGTAGLTIRQASGAAGWPGSIAPSPLDPASTFPLDGADVVQVGSRAEDGTDRTTAYLRHEGGRGYVVTVEAPATPDGRELARRLLGTLGFAAGAQVPGPDDLPQLPTTAVPDGWHTVERGDVRLDLPRGWAPAETPDGAGWGSEGGAETLSVGTRAPAAVEEEPSYGFRHDVPGADGGAVIQQGDDVTTDGTPRFLGTVELRTGDDTVVLSYSGPRGADSRERFGSIVRSLRVAGS
ncbi:hypothetical protein [Isoptericola sp. NPDC056605]|uniref:hypothetical protein n=1 Tax=Isoptericola sp. NPDC056605 TaxID=3345876 RepID=UPI003696BC54